VLDGNTFTRTPWRPAKKSTEKIEAATTATRWPINVEGRVARIKRVGTMFIAIKNGTRNRPRATAFAPNNRFPDTGSGVRMR